MPAMLILFGGDKIPPVAPALEAETDAPELVGVYRTRARRIASVILATGVACALASGISALGLRYNYDLWGLLPRRTESGDVALRIAKSSDVSIEFGAIMAPSLAEARRISSALDGKPEVSRVDSLVDFLPVPEGSREAALRRLGTFLDSMDWSLAR